MGRLMPSMWTPRDLLLPWVLRVVRHRHQGQLLRFLLQRSIHPVSDIQIRRWLIPRLRLVFHQFIGPLTGMVQTFLSRQRLR